PGAGVPAIADQRVLLHMLDDRIERPISIARRIFDLPAQVSGRQSLPEHGNRREPPVRRARYSRCRIIATLVMTIAAAQDAHAMTVRPANHARNVRPARIALQRSFQLMAVDATRVTKNGHDLLPSGQAFSLARALRGALPRSRLASGAQRDGDRR